jgi:hypothetical protein
MGAGVAEGLTSGFWAQPESSKRVAKTAVEAKRNGKRDIEKQLNN